MRALVTGGTGFIGRSLIHSLDRPVLLTRRPARAGTVLGRGIQAFPWDPEVAPPPEASFRGVDTVFHLAGEPVAGGRWTSERKQRIRLSRIQGTHNLVEGLRKAGTPLAVLVAASAVGYYGDRDQEVLDESSAPGRDFLADVCQAWEAEAGQARSLGIRVVTARIGIVLGVGGGALGKMLLPFRLGLGGRLGAGTQWMPWVHLDDLVGLLLHAASNRDISGAMNAVAPNPVTNSEFTRTLAAALRRPAIFPVPGFALRARFGEMAAILLGSQRVVPRVAERTGYRFRYPSLENALRGLIGRRELSV